MCTGLEIMMVMGAVGMAATTIAASGKKTPPVVSSSPLKDQAKIEADANAKALQEATARKRRQRSSSLLASGGAGDESEITTGSAGAKATLGA